MNGKNDFELEIQFVVMILMNMIFNSIEYCKYLNYVEVSPYYIMSSLILLEKLKHLK